MALHLNFGSSFAVLNATDELWSRIQTFETNLEQGLAGMKHGLRVKQLVSTARDEGLSAYSADLDSIEMNFVDMMNDNELVPR